jgi:hypothetical protein
MKRHKSKPLGKPLTPEVLTKPASLKARHEPHSPMKPHKSLHEEGPRAAHTPSKKENLGDVVSIVKAENYPPIPKSVIEEDKRILSRGDEKTQQDPPSIATREAAPAQLPFDPTAAAQAAQRVASLLEKVSRNTSYEAAAKIEIEAFKKTLT